LDPNDLPVSWGRGSVTSLQCGPEQILFHEGDEANAVYCLKSGMVKLYKSGGSGDPLIIRLVGPGHLVGYRAVLTDEPFAATAEVVGPTQVCRIPKPLFWELLETSRGFATRLARYIATELRISEEQLLAQAQHTVTDRTIRLLSLFLDEGSFEPRRDAPIHLPLLRSEFAKMVGTTPETLSRVLHRLADSGLLTLTRREIFVRDPEQLRARARRIFPRK